MGISSQPARDFMRRTIATPAQHQATPETAPEGGNPQSLTTTKEKHHA